MRDDEDETPRKRSRARDDDEEARPRKSRRSFDDDDDDDRPRRGKRGKPDNSGLVIAGVIVGGALLLFLVLGAIGYAVMKARHGKDGVDNPASIRQDDFDGEWPDDGMPAPPNTVILHILGAGGGNKGDIIDKRLNEIIPKAGFSIRNSMFAGGRLTIKLTPIWNVQEFSKKINFGRVVSVQGNVISIVYEETQATPNDPAPPNGPGPRPNNPSPRPAPGNDSVTNAIRDLKSNDPGRQKSACEALIIAEPDNQRTEVLKLLEPLNDLPDQDRDLRYVATQAYCFWATRDNTPTLIKILGGSKYQPRMKFAMDALVRLKDERGVAPIAVWLGTGGNSRFDSVAALKAYGSLAEDHMIKLLRGNSVDPRTGACEVLEAIGTQKCVPALEQAANDANFFVKNSAKRALEVVKKRG